MDVFNGCSFNSVKEIDRLRKELNRLLSTEMFLFN